MKFRRLLLLFSIAVISVAASGCGYNTLTTKQQNVKAKWSNVETQLQSGQAYTRPAGVEHNIVNASNHEFAFIEVELK